MATDINKIVIIGRLTKNPELKNINGTQLAKFTLASEQGFGDKKSTGFFDCIAWGKQAEIISKYMQRGNRVGIDGSLQFSSWEKDGQKRSKVEIRVDNFQFLEPKNTENHNENQSIQQSFDGTVQTIPDPFA